MKRSARQGGFTLMEVLIVIAIIGTVVTIATPLLMTYLPGKNLRASTRNLYSAAMQAKSEAVRRGKPVAVEFNPDKDHAYRIFEYQKSKETSCNETDPDKPKNILCGERLPYRVTFHTAATNCDPLIFTSRGLPITATGADGMCAVTLCTYDGVHADKPHKQNCRTVAISAAGRLRSNPCKVSGTTCK